MPWVLWQIRTLGHTCTGTCICTKKDDGTVKNNKRCPVSGRTLYVASVAFSPDGKSFISGSYDRSVIIWDTETGTKVSSIVGNR